ncbi:hypothetical protein [Pseudonocardia xishanensis]|uniref:PaaD zinc beta ribbon domain-containing protein n=1 Tax=Pseudonocardia xishanensis TaxID=630995 RepID=A0ABP8RHQ4_9PSEU
MAGRRRPTDEQLFADQEDFQGVSCPACGSADTRLQSLFGGAASEVTYFCQGCRSCFQWVKWQHRLPRSYPPGPQDGP